MRRLVEGRAACRCGEGVSRSVRTLRSPRRPREAHLQQAADFLDLRANHSCCGTQQLRLLSLQDGARLADQQTAVPGRAVSQRFAPVSDSKTALPEGLHRDQSTDLAYNTNT